jgi:hypothetical protein
MAKRVMLTLEDDTHALLSELSVLQGIPVATLIRGFVIAQVPAIELMVKALTELNMGKDPAEVEKDYLGGFAKTVLEEIRKG